MSAPLPLKKRPVPVDSPSSNDAIYDLSRAAFYMSYLYSPYGCAFPGQMPPLSTLPQLDDYRKLYSAVSPSSSSSCSSGSVSSFYGHSGSRSYHHEREVPETIVCEECGKLFSSKSRYRAHLRRHSSKTSGRYQCQDCDKTFVQRSSLTTHQRIHSGERPFRCDDCHESFGDFSTFTKHKRVHTGEKPYGCPVCLRRFSQSGNMHRHLKAVHGSATTMPAANLLLQ